MKLFCSILIAIVAIIGYFIVDLVIVSNALKTFKYFGNEGCVRVVGDKAIGLEDGDAQGDVVVFSSDDRHSWLMKKGFKYVKLIDTAPPGHLFRFDQGELKQINLKNQESNGQFHPHGISLKTINKQLKLWVVNHESAGDSIIIYDFDESTNEAKRIETIRDSELFRSVNDVVGIDDNSFYATIWQYYKEPGTLMNTVESFGRLPWTYVVFCERLQGKFQCRKVVDGLVGANGVNVSPDAKTVFVAECLKKRVGVYARSLSDNSLTLKTSLDIGVFADNIHVSDDDAARVFVTSHVKIFDFLAHVEDATHASPTQVDELIGDWSAAQPELKFKTLYLHDGINAGAVGFVHDNNLLIGAVFDEGLHVCPAKK